MSAPKTYKVLQWDNKPAETTRIELACSKCGTDAELEIGPYPGGRIIAAIGLGLIFEPAGYEPPPGFMPDSIQCRHCKTRWVDRVKFPLEEGA